MWWLADLRKREDILVLESADMPFKGLSLEGHDKWSPLLLPQARG